MKFILENYLIFVLIGLFLVFALIGYIIDTIRKSNSNNSTKENFVPPQVNEVGQDNNGTTLIDTTNNTNESIPQIESVNITSINENVDDLLNSYNDTNN